MWRNIKRSTKSKKKFQFYIITSRKPVQCIENELELNLKNYWFNYDFYCLLYFI
jgi:hypothetical protein